MDVLIILLGIGVLIFGLVALNSGSVDLECEWCGKVFTLSKREYRRKRKFGIFCSGRCRRAEESSRGVKEKRVRWIDHE